MIKVLFPRVHSWFARLYLNYKMATTKPRPDVEIFAEAWANSDYEVRPEELVRSAVKDWKDLTIGERWRLNAYDMFIELQRVKRAAAERKEMDDRRIQWALDEIARMKAQVVALAALSAK